MAHKLFAILTCLFLGYFQLSAAQIPSTNMSIDSIMTIVISRINSHKPSLGDVSRADYEKCFSVEDLATHKSILEQGYGIYAFGLLGDDVPCWIIWWDATGYKIYGYELDTNMLRDFFAYFERNKIPDAKSFQYVKGMYDALVRMEYGEQEIHIKDPR